jgi:hypothetical protein
MNALRWFRRTIRRFNRAAEETALGASVLQTPGAGGAQPNAMGVKAVLGEIEQAERAADSGEADVEDEALPE